MGEQRCHLVGFEASEEPDVVAVGILLFQRVGKRAVAGNTEFERQRSSSLEQCGYTLFGLEPANIAIVRAPRCY